MGDPMGPLGGPSGTPEVEQDWNKIGTRKEERNKKGTRIEQDMEPTMPFFARMEQEWNMICCLLRR